MLASSTDGVGTKLAIAQTLDRHDTIGIDLVAMVVDDLVVVGAEPLFLTDYIATGKVVPEKIAAIVSGIAEGCVQAGCALVGGETAEHPGVMRPDEYDVSGTGVGVVNADAVLGPDRMIAGDVLIALGSSGLHSNGYSLVRHVLLKTAGIALDATPEVLAGGSLADELLTPTRVYAQDCLALAAECAAHGFAHVTGGGLAGESGARAAAAPRRGGGPVHVGPAADFRVDRRRRRDFPRAVGADLQPGRGHDRGRPGRSGCRRSRHSRMPAECPHGRSGSSAKALETSP